MPAARETGAQGQADAGVGTPPAPVRGTPQRAGESVSECASPMLRCRIPALDSAIRAVAHDAAALGRGRAADEQLGRRVERALAGVCVSAAPGPGATDGSPGMLEVEAHVSEGELLVSIADHGGGPGSVSRTPGLDAGLPQLAGCSDGLEVSGRAGGPVIRLPFALAPRAPAAAGDRPRPARLPADADPWPSEPPVGRAVPARAARARCPIRTALGELARRGRPEAGAELHRLAELLADPTAPADTLRALELAAEATRAAVNAATVAVSRWEREPDALRTLVNVGELAPGEERFPASERYALADYPVVDDQLKHLRPYRWAVGDGVEDASERLLLALGKAYEAGVPITLAGTLWGELWAARGGLGRRFDRHDLALLQIAAQLTSAILARHEHRPGAAARGQSAAEGPYSGT